MLWIDQNACAFLIPVFWCIVNAGLLVLCWIPPILRFRVKVFVAVAALFPLLSFLLDWERLITEIAAALGQGNRLAGVGASDWVFTIRFLAEFGYIVFVLVVLTWVALEVSRRRHNRDLDQPDDMEEGA
jgi:hypothetical protein